MVPAPVSVDLALRELASPVGPVELARVAAVLDAGHGDRLDELVRRHRLDGAYADALARLGRPVPTPVADAVVDDRVMRLQVMSVLRRAAAALDNAAIPWLTFKGPVVASLMDRPELRTYNDLDLLVAASRFGDAIDALVDAGIDEINQNWTPYVRHRVGEVPMEAGDVSVDLHWHVVGLGRHRRALRFDPTAMLDRRRMVEVVGVATPVFDPCDQLLHLAVHAGLSGATRLDQLRDLAVVLARDPVDWDAFAQRAKGVGAASLAGHALDRAGRVLGGGPPDAGTVPEAVLRRLAGSSLDRRRRLDGETVAGLRGIAVWWRRDRPVASAGAALIRLGDAVAAKAGRAQGWDFLDEASRLYFRRPSGGAAMRAEYLRRVADWV